jgi:hypothetical protein
MKMKKILSISLAAVAGLMMASCSDEAPMDTDLYPQTVYIVGAHNRIIDANLDLRYPVDTVNLSVSVSGNRILDRDVKVTLAECPEAIQYYNEREVSAQARQFRHLGDTVYSIPSNEVTVQAGEVYHTFPIYVNPQSLKCDSLYMLAFKIAGTSEFKATKTDTVALVNLHLSNPYSGQYYMNGVIKAVDNPNDSLVYVMPRKLVATDDGQTVRMFHYNNEWQEGAMNDYRPTSTFKITVNPDQTLKLTSWDKFDLQDGGGKYYPEMKAYALWYTYRERGKLWKTVGFLYKERKNNTQQHEINDWMEDMRASGWQ